MRPLREMRVQGRPRRLKPRADRPPAESECLKRKSTSKSYKQKKLKTNTIFIELPTVWVLQHDETPLKMI